MPSIQEQLVALGLSSPKIAQRRLPKHQTLCSVCKEPIHLANLEKHLKEEHGIFKTATSLIQCDKCGVSVSHKNLEKHIRKVHEKRSSQEKKNKAKSKICDICGQEIAGSMKLHKKATHPARKPQFAEPKSRGKPKPLSPQEAKARLKEIRDQRLFQDKATRTYLARVPEAPKYGKFGLPQDKYRWGFYGHSSMEYDVWGRS